MQTKLACCLRILAQADEIALHLACMLLLFRDTLSFALCGSLVSGAG